MIMKMMITIIIKKTIYQYEVCSLAAGARSRTMPEVFGISAVSTVFFTVYILVVRL